MATLTTSWQELISATLYNNIVIKIDGRYDSQSVSGNYTIAQFRFRNTGTYWRTSSGTAKFTGAFTDSQSCATYPKYINNGDTIFTITKTISHDEDGTKSINLGGTLNAYLDDANRTANLSQVSITMPPITRYAKITGANDFNDEESPKLTFVNTAGYRVNARLEFTGTSFSTINRENIPNTGEYEFILTTEERNLLRQQCLGKTMMVRYVIATCIDGTTETNWTWLDKTMTMINSEPSATYTIEEQDANVISLIGSSSANKIIQNASDLLFTITPTALKYATISSVQVNNQYATLDSGDYKININDITTNEFNILITDSRGFTKSYPTTKELLSYNNCKINTWSIVRQTQISSNLVLNANVSVFNNTINGTQNTFVVKYSLDNTNWTTIPTSSYTITDNILKIEDLVLNNLVNYKNIATFYLDISDLLSEAKENYQISKGIETYSWGENDLQVNGEIFIADEDGENEYTIENNFDYSTTEQIIGTWLGKPLYRKVLPHTKTSGTTNTIDPQVSNVDKIWVNYGESFVINSGFTLGLINYGGVNDWIRTYIYGGTITLQVGSDYSSATFDCYITIYYTKTTD